MAPVSVQRNAAAVWALVREQHGVVTQDQLERHGYTYDAITHRLDQGRLHRIFLGVYAVGRPQLTRHGRWMAAVLACGPGAALSHQSGGELLRVRAYASGRIEVSVPAGRRPRCPGVRIHRRTNLTPDEVITRDGIPVTSPTTTLVDLAPRLTRDALEAAINEADKLDLVDPEALRRGLERLPRRPGKARLRQVLDRRTFALTDSALERMFLPIVRRVGLPKPLTGAKVNGFDVDFYWPDLRLVVETDGLRYHRTPAQQARDRLRDQAHAAAGLTPLRFTRAQVRFEAAHVEAILTEVSQRLAAVGGIHRR